MQQHIGKGGSTQRRRDNVNIIRPKEKGKEVVQGDDVILSNLFSTLAHPDLVMGEGNPNVDNFQFQASKTKEKMAESGFKHMPRSLPLSHR